MKKRNITLCAVAMLCMQGYAKADTFILKGDNTCVENYAQMTAAYKSNRPKMKKRLFTSKADKRRSEYYNYYSYKTWGAAATYHLCVDSSSLGVEETVRFIEEFVVKKLQLI